MKKILSTACAVLLLATALISCGKNNTYGHPHAELLKRLNATKTRVFRTDHSGAIRFSLNNQRISIENYLDL